MKNQFDELYEQADNLTCQVSGVIADLRTQHDRFRDLIREIGAGNVRIVPVSELEQFDRISFDLSGVPERWDLVTERVLELRDMEVTKVLLSTEGQYSPGPLRWNKDRCVLKQVRR